LATDVIVIGAGVIGAACAWRLRQAGLNVTWLEREAPAAGASRAALGVLHFHATPGAPAGFAHLTRRSAALYPALIEALYAATGERVPYQAEGELSIALAEEDWRDLEADFAWNAALGIAAERLSTEDCLRLEPGLNPAVLGGMFYPGDASVDNAALTLALARAARRDGVSLESAAVTAVTCHNGRVSGVRAGEREYAADWVVLAAGCWSGQIAGVPPLPVRPVRGQALAVGGRPVRRMISSARGHVVPRASGHTLVGATVEEVGYDDGLTLGGVAEVAAIGLEIAPRLAGLAWAGAWAGLRPGTPDGMPYIGPFAGCPNLIAATGHFRNGILLAPSTAELVTRYMRGEEVGEAAKGLGPDRDMKKE
jgi:glycine oxidase